MHTLALVEFVCLCACVCISMCVYVCTFTRTFFKSHVTNVTSMCLTLSKYSHFCQSTPTFLHQLLRLSLKLSLGALEGNVVNNICPRNQLPQKQLWVVFDQLILSAICFSFTSCSIFL